MDCPATLNASGRGEDGKYFSLWEPDVRLDQQYLWRCAAPDHLQRAFAGIDQGWSEKGSYAVGRLHHEHIFQELMHVVLRPW